MQKIVNQAVYEEHQVTCLLYRLQTAILYNMFLLLLNINQSCGVFFTCIIMWHIYKAFKISDSVGICIIESVKEREGKMLFKTLHKEIHKLSIDYGNWPNALLLIFYYIFLLLSIVENI